MTGIPGELGNLSNLESLYLSSNELTGIPGELGNLPNLETLYLGFNELAGPVPAELGNLSNLETLYLGFNELTGPIPAELGNLSNLKSLNLSNNRLTGPIPAELGSLSNLEYLQLGGNQLTGCIPQNLRRIQTNDLSQLGLPFCDMPGAPTIATPIVPGDASLTVAWAAPINTGSSAITAYDLRHTQSSADEMVDANWTVVEDVWTTDSGSLQYTLTGLTGGTQYDVQVRAVNTDGPGAWSATVTGTTTSVVVPGAPTGLTATANGQTQINLSWSAPASDGGSAITGYRIEVSANGSAWRDLETDTGSTSTSYSHTGLTTETTRHYRVSAINSVGTGSASNVASATTTLDQAGTVTLSTMRPVVGAELTATLSDPDGGVTDVTWQWAESLDGTTSWADIAGATSMSYTPTAMDDGYYLRATATYTDPLASGKTARAVSDYAVTAGDPLVARYDANNNGTIERNEVIAAINDYLFSNDPISRSDVIRLINLYLFG